MNKFGVINKTKKPDAYVLILLSHYITNGEAIDCYIETTTNRTGQKMYIIKQK